jgi:hypothetical protein
MKVRCKSLKDSRGNPQSESSWLAVGKVYNVMALELDNNGEWLARLVGDGLNGVALFRLELFEMESSVVSPTWTTTWKNGKLIELSPERWMRDGFWEEYYDRDPAAIRIFEEDKKVIVDADP